MRNRMYGGVRGRKTKVGRKLLHFPPTRFPPFTDPRNTQSTRIHGAHRVHGSTEHTECMERFWLKIFLKIFVMIYTIGYFLS